MMRREWRPRPSALPLLGDGCSMPPAALIAEHGVANTSVAAIGERAEMSRGAANFHFGSKDALILALAQEVSAEIDQQAQRAAARIDEPCTLEQLVDAILGVQFDLLRTNPERARLIEMLTYEASGPSPLLRSHFAAHYARLQERLTARLQEMLGRGAVRADLDTAAGAVVVMAVCRGLAAQYLLAPGTRMWTRRCARRVAPSSQR